MKQDIIEILLQSKLCQGMTEEQVLDVIKNGKIKKYKKNDIIFMEGDTPETLFVLVEGKVSICKDSVSGKRMLLTDIVCSGDLFGEIYVFMGKEEYDIYALANEDTAVLEIQSQLFFSKKEKVVSADIIIMQNLLRLFAAKAYVLNEKVKILGSGGIREKIVRYLSNNQKADGTIQLYCTREEMADYLNVARPSLSREIGKMEEDGLIKVNGKKIIVVNAKKFDEYL